MAKKLKQLQLKGDGGPLRRLVACIKAITDACKEKMTELAPQVEQDLADSDSPGQN